MLSNLIILRDKCQTKSFEDERFNQSNSQLLYHQSTFLEMHILNDNENSLLNIFEELTITATKLKHVSLMKFL